MRLLGWTTIETPLGPVSAGCSDAGLASVRFGPPPAGSAAAFLPAVREQLSGYFSRTLRGFDLPLDWASASPAQRRVLSLLAETVGYGETISYGALARRLARRESGPAIPARAIGGIMAANPIPLVAPCHRVVAADGLGGFSGGTGVELKRWLLTFEGALPEMLDFAAS